MTIKNPFITKYQGGFLKFQLRKLKSKTLMTDGKIKNGYTLILGLILGFILGVSL